MDRKSEIKLSVEVCSLRLNSNHIFNSDHMGRTGLDSVCQIFCCLKMKLFHFETIENQAKVRFVWGNQGNMQQDDLLHFGLIFLY